ncbi:MAG: discoidin domain-containing protein, partial [Bacteroidia bacterium]|nr:discoidin domain-containing protein [Bacteroidia bacterium]
STATNPSTTYATAGTYNVTLTVTNTVTSTSASITKQVTVYPVPGATITRGAPYNGPTVPGGIGIDFFSNATNTISSPPTTYTWNFGSGATPPTSTAANPTGVVFNVLGTHTVTLTVANGTCVTTVQQTFNVIAEDVYKGGPNDGAAMSDEGIDAEIVGSPGEICPGETVQLNASVTGATVTAWLWTPATWLSATNIHNPQASPLVTTTYTVRANIAGGCLPKETQVTVYVKPFGILADAGPDHTICGLVPVKLGTPAQTGGTYSWAPATGLNNPNIAEPIFTPPAIGTYNFTLTVHTTGFDCPTKDYVTVVVNPNPGINLGPDKFLCPAQSSATISVTPPPNSRVQWQPNKLVNLNYTLSPVGYRTIFNCSNYMTRYSASTEDASSVGQAYTADFYCSGFMGSGWRPTVDNTSQWISYDMGRDTILVSITTYGKPSFTGCCPTSHPARWVTSYQVDYSSDGTTWTVYKENGNPVTFTGNTNATNPVTHTFNEPIFARYIRIRPLTWSSAGIGLRFFVQGHEALGSRWPYESAVTSQNVKPGTFIVHAFVPGCGNRLSDTITVHPAIPIPTHYRTHSNGNWANDATWQVLNEANMTWVWVPALDPCYNVHWPDWTKKTILVRDSVDYDCPAGTMIDECTISPTGVIRIPANKNFELRDGAGAGLASINPPSYTYVS